jgi:acetyl esterase/lipase
MQQLSARQVAGVWLVRAISATVFTALALGKRGTPVSLREYQYGTHRDERLDHQVPLVAAASNGSAIIYLHGGGWIACSKNYYPADLQFLCNAGYTVFNVDYPLAPEQPHPQMLQSIFRAVAWIKRKHPYLQRVHMMGDSAGANLAAMYCVVCANPELLPTFGSEFAHTDLLEPASLVSLYGLLERETLLGDDPAKMNAIMRLFLQCYGGLAALKPGKPHPENAITPLDLDWLEHPPCFLGVGDIDFLYASSARYARELQARDVSLTHKVYPGAPHGFLNQRHAQTPKLKQDVLEFLAANS